MLFNSNRDLHLKIIQNHPLAFNAMILTIAGVISRILGFLYRIFLANVIGAELLGIFQLILPVYMLFVSLSSGGIQIAMSRFVAENIIYKKDIEVYKSKNRQILTAGLVITLLFSVFFSFLLFILSNKISLYYLQDSRTCSLLKLLSLAVPMTSLHACITGYYLGSKNAFIPSIMQIAEQIIKLLSLALFFHLPAVFPAVLSILLSELIGSIILFISIKKELFSRCTDSTGENNSLSLDNGCLSNKNLLTKRGHNVFNYGKEIKKILSVSYILTANKVILTVLGSIEAALIPAMLIKFGLSSSSALAKYGTFSGMAFPVISFPSAIVASIGASFLPALAEASVSKKYNYATQTTIKLAKLTLEIGIACTILFLLSGNFIGNVLFGEALCSTYIKVLSWLCPFIYLEIFLGSVLHSLGRTKDAFIHNIINCAIKIYTIIVFIPRIGISGYLYGLFIGTILTVFLHGSVIYLSFKKNR